MKYFIFVILFVLSFLAQAQSVEECSAEYIDISPSQRTLGGYPYFKKLSYYTQSGRQDASSDTLYFMTLNYFLNIKLTWSQYYELQKKMNATPGENSYSSPSLDVLIPLMQNYLKKLGYKQEVTEELISKAKDHFSIINKNLLPEIMGGNRIIYRTLDSEKQSITRDEGDGNYIVRVKGCSTIYRMNMSDYQKYSTIEQEEEALMNILNQADIRETLEFYASSLYQDSFFNGKISSFLENH